MDIIYEDNHLLVVFKHANVLSQGDYTRDISIYDMAYKYMQDIYNKDKPYIKLLSRLDRPVSGLIILTKSSKATNRLAKAIANREIDKYYLAVVHDNNLADSSRFIDYLSSNDNFTKVVSKDKGKLATLEYKVIARKDNLALVNIKLITGRKHQIRVQFASRNHPIVGDNRYGLKEQIPIALSCYNLVFKHPTTKEILEIKHIDVLDNKAFNLFKDEIDSLSKKL